MIWQVVVALRQIVSLYSSNKITKYFNKYKNHELIQYIKNELIKNGITNDAVMSMAISITHDHLN